jgi:putative peptidoglycan lipid II flippase
MAEAKDIRRNTLVVGAANVLARMTGLVREVAFAAAFGAGLQADAFNAAFRIGSLFRELFAEGALSNAFIPLYAQIAEKEGQASAFRLANAFLGVLLAVVGGVTVLTFVAAEPLVHLIASGYAEVPGKVELTATLTRVLAPFVATVSVASVFMGIMNVRGRFFLPAAAPMIFNALVIAACALSGRFGEATGYDPVMLVAIAALLGGLSQALIQVPGLLRQGFRFELTFGAHPALRRLLAFIGPAVIAISVTQIHLLIETQLASREGDGPVSWLLYAFRVAHLPFSIVSGAVGVAALAGLSVYAAQADWGGFKRSLAGALNLNSFLMIPSAVGIFLLAEPVVSLFYERGAFTPQDTLATSALLQMYCLGLLGIGAQRILVPVFYTLQDPRTPMWVGLGTVLLKLPLALWLMRVVSLQGLPLSHAILASIEVLFLLWLIQRRVPGLWRLLLGFHGKVVLASALMAGLVWGLGLALDGTTLVLAAVPLGALAYFTAADLMGLREGRELIKKVLRRGPRGLPPTIDAQTQDALRRLDGARQLPFEDGRIDSSEGRVVFGVLEGGLRAELQAAPPLKEGELRAVLAVLRVGGGPPRLVGLDIGEQCLRVEGEAVVLGRAEGLRVNLAGEEV